MKYIITSGPMETAIDSVRRIQNSSSGKLGATVAKQLQLANITDVVYIHTPGAVVPQTGCKTILINDHQQLLTALETEIDDCSVVIHAMAISDFYTAGTLTQNQLAKLIIDNKQALNSEDDVLKLLAANAQVTDKLASSSDQLILMNRSIKVIDEIKKINPAVKLIGFKLLSNVSVEQLIEVGTNIKNRANCDYVVANLKEEVSSCAHHAYIIGDEQVFEVGTKIEIAKKLIQLMEE